MESLAEALSQQTKEEIKVKDKGKKKNYSTLEILIVISAIAIVIALVLLGINPGKKGSEARNSKRRADISYIHTQVSNYSREKGDIPEAVPVSEECLKLGNEICKMGEYECKELVDLSFLRNMESKDIVKIPTDPMSITSNSTGYYISQDGKGGLTVCAPYAERNEDITFTKYLY